MKVGVLTVLYHAVPLDTVLDKLAALHVECVELATGNYLGNAHADPDVLLADRDALDGLRRSLASRRSKAMSRSFSSRQE